MSYLFSLTTRLCGVALSLALTLAACGGSPESTTVPPATSPWDAVDQTAAAAFATVTDLPGMTLTVYDRNDNKVFEQNYGTFSADQRVSVASASKMVSGTLIFRLIDRGLLSLDSTTGDVLGWTGANRNITLRHLLSFTSGLEPNPLCLFNRLTTLEACVNNIRDTPLKAPPGTQFEYGGAHLQVAARMAEMVTSNTPWDTLFIEELRTPLGLPAEVNYYTTPWITTATGTTNPMIAGGLFISSNEYAKLLAIPFHRGTYQGTSFASTALFDLQAIEPYPGVTIVNSPLATIGLPFRYGLAAWLECTTPATGCTVLSSPGAFGFTPWFDRENGYYAILAMEKGVDPNVGVVEFSVNLVQQLKPLIVQALQ